jgi:hypothetical protein
MSTPKPFPAFHQFTVDSEREIDQVNTRVEDGKTITETTKVKKTVSLPFCLKLPSRTEREEADIVRAVWWTKFMERGVTTEAMLIKRYTNEGGTLPNEYRTLLEQLQTEFLDVQVKLTEAETLHKDEPDILRPLRYRFFDLREKITEIHRSQAPYFENTAEAKARQKHIEWLVLNMTYHKKMNADESVGEWEPFFTGKTMDDKLDYYDKLVEKEDELWAKAKSMLELLATFYSSSGGNISSEEISDFLLEEALKNGVKDPAAETPAS